MSYLTLKEAAEATGLNEATIRRLCKKIESKPFVQLNRGKKGFMYTIQANYLFDIYPPLKSGKHPTHTSLNNEYTTINKEPAQDYTALLSAKDEIIQLLKSETAYLRTENIGLREEDRILKLLSAPSNSFESVSNEPNGDQEPQKKSFWQRLFG